MSSIPTVPIPTSPIKPGWKSSEFWVTMAALGAIIFSGASGQDANATTEVLTTATAAVYNLVRMFVKIKK